jgi:hypothetical protein
VRLAERDHARREQALDAHGRLRRHAAQPGLRARRRLPAGDVEQVLDRDRQLVQQAPVEACRALEVSGLCEAQGVVAPHLDERVQLRVLRVDVREARLDDRA